MTQIALKRDCFTQVPNVVFDCALSDIEKLGFLQFLRHFGQQGYFEGSLGALCRTIKMAKATISRAIQKWLQFGWISREETDVGIRLTLQIEKVWQDNPSKRNRSCEEQQSRNETQKDSSVPARNSSVSHRNTTVPTGNTAVPIASSKSTQYRGNMDSNISPNMEEEYREAPKPEATVPASLPLPSLPPVSLDSFSSLREKLSLLDTTHLAPCRKEADMEEAFQALSQRLEALAVLIGEEDALRQAEVAILYFKHVEKFWKDHHELLTLVKINKFYEEIAFKSRDWTPPAHATRLYPEPEVPHAHPITQDIPQSCVTIAQPVEVTQGNGQGDTWGMTQTEAEALEQQITAQYPGMQTSWGQLPSGRSVLGLYIERDVYCDLYTPEEWMQPVDVTLKQQIAWALEAYAQYAGAVTRDERVAV